MLAEMQGRISQGPHAALGTAEHATAEQVRSAFLQLTKQFHPARFGRMANDVQRLSNEVFLGIKAAHDALMKPLGGGKRGAMQSGGMPVIQSEGSVRTAVPGRPTTTGSIPVVQRPPTGGVPPLQRPAPVPPSTFARGTDRPSDRPTERPSSPAIPRTTTPSIAPAIPRTTTPMQPTRASTPALGTPVQRPSTPVMRPVTPTGARPPTPPGRPPSASQALNPDTVRGSLPPREPAFDERAALRESLMQLNDENWAAARQTLQNLAAKVPQSKNYRALLAYARGREAQAAGKPDEAALEYQRALQIDPELSVAKQALADVQRRR